MKDMVKHLSLLVATFLVAACGTPSSSKLPPGIADRPPAYQEGYTQGCDFGRVEAAKAKRLPRRDDERLQTDSAYANGWHDGREACRDNYQPSAAEKRNDPTKPVRTEGGW